MSVLRKNIRDRRQTFNNTFTRTAYREAGHAVVGGALSGGWWNATARVYSNSTGEVLFAKNNHRLGKFDKAAMCLGRAIAGYVAKDFKIDPLAVVGNIVAEYVLPNEITYDDINDFDALHDSYKRRAIDAYLDTLKKNWHHVENIAQVFIKKGPGSVEVPGPIFCTDYWEFDHEPLINSLQIAA